MCKSAKMEANINSVVTSYILPPDQMSQMFVDTIHQ